MSISNHFTFVRTLITQKINNFMYLLICLCQCQSMYRPCVNAFYIDALTIAFEISTVILLKNVCDITSIRYYQINRTAIYYHSKMCGLSHVLLHHIIYLQNLMKSM